MVCVCVCDWFFAHVIARLSNCFLCTGVLPFGHPDTSNPAPKRESALAVGLHSQLLQEAEHSICVAILWV